MDQQIIIVDERDDEIGSADRNSVTPGDQRIFRATGLWITNSKGNILLAQRSFTKHSEPGKWGPASSGTLEVGETYLSNIIKETREELGLLLQTEDLLVGPKLFSQVKFNLFAQWYFLTLDEPIHEFTLQKAEVEQTQWFERDILQDQVKTQPGAFLHWIPILLEYTSGISI